MADLIGLVALLLIIGAVWGVVSVVSWSRNHLDSNRALVRTQRHQLNEDEKTLRRIANGAASPALEAQIRLDEITNYNERQLDGPKQ